MTQECSVRWSGSLWIRSSDFNQRTEYWLRSAASRSLLNIAVLQFKPFLPFLHWESCQKVLKFFFKLSKKEVFPLFNRSRLIIRWAPSNPDLPYNYRQEDSFLFCLCFLIIIPTLTCSFKIEVLKTRIIWKGLFSNDYFHVLTSSKTLSSVNRVM